MTPAASEAVLLRQQNGAGLPKDDDWDLATVVILYDNCLRNSIRVFKALAYLSGLSLMATNL